MGLFITDGDDILLINLFSMLIVIIGYADMLPSLHICVLASFLYGCLMMVRNTHAGSATAWVISLTIARTLFVSTVRNWGTKPSCVPAWNCTVYVNITHIGLDIAPIRGIASLPPPPDLPLSLHPSKTRISRSQLMTSLNENQNNLAWLSSCQLLLMSPLLMFLPLYWPPSC